MKGQIQKNVSAQINLDLKNDKINPKRHLLIL